MLTAFTEINAKADFWGTALLLGAVVPDGFGFVSSSGQQLVNGPNGITYLSALMPLVAVPEPATLALLAVGIGAISVLRRRASNVTAMGHL